MPVSNRASTFYIAVIAGSLSLAACADEPVETDVVETEDVGPDAILDDDDAAKGQNIARTRLTAPDGTDHGEVIVAEGDGGLMLELKATGLTPGMHGAHIHTAGVCNAPDYKSAGGHWNPTNQQHGLENPKGSHFGDMKNLTVDEDGNGTLETRIEGASLRGGEYPLFDADGAAFIIHAGRDDQKTDPAGDSGDRIACGVFEGY